MVGSAAQEELGTRRYPVRFPPRAACVFPQQKLKEKLSLGGHLGVGLRWFGDRCGVIPGSFWGYLGILFGSVWIVWDRFGIIWGYFWDRFGIILESFWNQFGISLRSLCDTFLQLFCSRGASPPHSDRHKAGPTYQLCGTRPRHSLLSADARP